MRTPILCASLFALFGIRGLARAQEFLTPAQAVEQATRGNLALETARRELGVAEGLAIQAGAPLNPEVGAQWEGQPKWSWAPGEASRSLGVDQTIELWGKRRLRRSSAAAQLDADRARYRVMEAEVSRRVKDAYWNLSLSRERHIFAEENLKFQQRFLGQVQDRFQTGRAKLADVSRAKLEVARATNEILVAAKEVKDSQAGLNRLLGRDPSQDIPQVEHLREPNPRLLEEDLARRALERRPERSILSALDRGAGAELSLAERLLWVPDLKAGFQLEKRKSIDGSDSWGTHVGLVFPLWYRYAGERRSASARVAAVEARKRDMEQEIRLELRKAFLEVGLSAQQVKVFREAVDQATEAARLAEQQYREGDADLLVATQARRDLVSSTQDLLSELRDYWRNLAALEQAVGEDLGGY